MFKRHQDYRLIALEHFIEFSFASYAQFLKDDIKPDPRFSERYEVVKSVIAEETSVPLMQVAS
ncbi:hypothetical protein [Rhizobium sp. P38BS-XIX]|uniref:hypothetical protein n=1 Tax=Rhizobium sp. P38BS-XIX TaxID=2726740 RepID=UPI00197F7E3A|nr:hypothetical protein [Rhizobium sp. P38BS-XIX]